MKRAVVMLAVVGLTLVASATLGPTLARAADRDERDVTILPGHTIQALSADLDADGSREIVRLIPGDHDPYLVFVDVWREEASGWERAGAPRGVGRIANEDELAYLRRDVLDEQGLLALNVGEPARLIVWTDAGRERVALVTSAIGDEWWVPCCLTISSVELNAGGVELPLVSGDSLSGDSVLALDLDGDGTDELVVVEPPQGSWSRRPGAPARVRAYAWDGAAFTERASIELSRSTTQTAFVLGDTDGRPGEELGLLDSGAGELLLRVAQHDAQALTVESAQVADLAPPVSWTFAVAAVPGTPPRLVLVSDHRTQFAEWPAGEELRIVRTVHPGGRLLGVVGEGVGAHALVADENGGVVHSFSPTAGAMLLAASDEAAALRGSPLTPYAGPLPGGTAAGEAAVVFGGRLLRGPSTAGTISFSGIASMGGAQPIGLAGRDASSLAVLHTSVPMLAPERGGGRIRNATPLDGAMLALVPRGAAFGAGAAAVTPARPAVEDAISADGEAGEWTITTSPRGFTIVVDAPPGSRASVVIGDERIGPNEATDVAPESRGVSRVSVEVPPELLARDSDGRMTIEVATPAGHAYQLEAALSVVDEPPQVHVETPFAPLGEDVSIAGSTAAGAQVHVDGEAVAVDRDGRFSAIVRAGIWPTDVRVEVVDAIGNRAVEVVGVVGYVDYRRLPWLAIAVAATLVAAVRLAWRAPALVASDRLAGGAVLEEIDR
ncbi:MAG: hypothetical protein ABR509_08750 [Candidatus Limnocylindria bacterium]